MAKTDIAKAVRDALVEMGVEHAAVTRRGRETKMDTKNAERRIDQVTELFRAHGYVVVSEPVSGSEELFADALWQGARKVEETVACHSRKYGYRGLSKKALAALHNSLPNPTWGVEVAGK